MSQGCSSRIDMEVNVFNIKCELLSSLQLMSFRLTFNQYHYILSCYVLISLYNLLNQKKLRYIVLTYSFFGCITQCVSPLFYLLFYRFRLKYPPLPLINLFLNFESLFLGSFSHILLLAQTNLFILARQQLPKMLRKYIYLNTFFFPPYVYVLLWMLREYIWWKQNDFSGHHVHLRKFFSSILYFIFITVYKYKHFQYL